MAVSNPQVVSVCLLRVTEPDEAAGPAYWLPEAGVPGPNIVPLAELMINPQRSRILAGICRSRVKAVKTRIPRQVRRRKHVLRVCDHAPVEHGRGNLVARYARRLNIAWRR